VNRHLGGSGSVDVFVKVRHVCLAVGGAGDGRQLEELELALYVFSTYTKSADFVLQPRQSEMREISRSAAE
jgi:hypothetical protein